MVIRADELQAGDLLPIQEVQISPSTGRVYIRVGDHILEYPGYQQVDDFTVQTERPSDSRLWPL